jgi:DNA-binding ferritin-like protein
MKTVQEFVAALFEIETLAQVAHWQTTGPGSLAQHTALGDLYDSMPDLRDTFVEAYQGRYGIIKGYPSFTTVEGLEFVPYLTEKMNQITRFRENVLDDGYLEQLVDNVQEKLSTVLYKLKFLK